MLITKKNAACFDAVARWSVRASAHSLRAQVQARRQQARRRVRHMTQISISQSNRSELQNAGTLAADKFKPRRNRRHFARALATAIPHATMRRQACPRELQCFISL